MHKRLRAQLEVLLCCALLIGAADGATAAAHAQDCPTSADEIATDRPDVTNSSLVVPLGSLQAENGVDGAVRRGSNVVDGSNTRLRLGLARCSELLIDLPDYFGSLDRARPSGFSDVVASLKRQLPAPFELDLSATVGSGFPSGSEKIAGRGYQPYLQFPWSRTLAAGWSVAGMFTVTWFPGDARRNPTFEPTFSVQREFGSFADAFIEYVGDYDHQRPAQLVDGGGAWRFTPTQQVDFHAGLGLNSATVDRYFGIGYSVRLDR